MKPGDIVADRFIVERLAGRGGMGSVYRAVDRTTDEQVALKVLDGGPEVFEERFFREARVLASIKHPAVVRYIAQGATGGALWIAMEWLEGDDLSMRLARGRIDLASSLVLVARAAEGVAEAHAAGVVHRDLKPSNLFLVGGDAAALKVLDFGVAKLGARTRAVTRTGQMVGTVGYMAPEQITGERDVDTSADLFSLGCVLFECVTGTPAFNGETLIAIIAKVLRDAPPSASELEPSVPPELDELIRNLLDKDRTKRPKSARDVAERLRSMVSSLPEAPPLSRRARASISGREQRLVSAILVSPRENAEGSTNAIAEELASSFGVDVSDLGGGAYLFVVASSGTAKDQAARAASCAIAIRARLGEPRIAIGTGLATPTCGLPIGPAIDRAAALLDVEISDGAPFPILLDDVTAGLLDDRFEVEANGAAFVLVGGARVARSAPPPPRGTPFVGREKEMAIVEAVLAESRDERVARAVIVTGPAGGGKSRLRREFIGKAAHGGKLRTVVARADVVGSGGALSLVKQIALRLVSLTDAESRDERGERVRAFVGSRPGRGDAAHTIEFLSELVGATTHEEPSAELVAARSDPRGMSAWLRKTFAELCSDEARRDGLVIVLEDLHWGDEASVDFVGEALRQAKELPLFVLALARTEVWEALPRLRELLDPHEVRLAGLTPRAAQRLAEAALGDASSPDLVQRIVARSEGNPFFLEELARSAAEGRTDTSETVLAVVQSRIQRLDAEARRLLRAASVFGREFRPRGVTRLMGLPEGAVQVEGLLRHLVEREMIEPLPVAPARAHSQTDAGYAFRHDLLREAAYATLPEADKPRAHALAAEWLEREGDVDASVMAEHFERAGDAPRAVEWLVKATEEAHNAGSYERVCVLAARGIAAGATGVQRGALRAAEGLARAWRHDWKRSHPATSEALTLLPQGSASWFRAAAVHTFGSVSLGDGAAIGELTQTVVALADEPESTGAYAFALFALVNVLSLVGQRAIAEHLVAKLDARDKSSTDFAFVAWRALARTHLSLSTRGAPGEAWKHLEVASRFARGVSDSVAKVATDFYRLALLQDCGDAVSAEREARSILVGPGSDAVPYLRSWSLHTLGHALLVSGQHQAAIELAENLVSSDDALFTQRARSLLGQALLAARRFDEASLAARAVIDAAPSPQDKAAGLSIESAVELSKGHADKAIELARSALDLVEKSGCTAATASMLELAHLEALLAADAPALDPALVASIARIETVARSLSDSLQRAWREGHVNRRILEIARLRAGTHATQAGP